MALAVCILIIAVITLSIHCIQLRREINNINLQLNEVKDINTNLLIHSKTGTADQLINEINSLLRKIRDIRADYSRKSHELEQMMTNISHDLRTPLTSAMGYINLIQNADLSETEKSRELDIVGQRLVRLEELINSFFELSQIVSSGKEPEKTEINLISLLEESIVHYYDDYCNQGRLIAFECEYRKLIFLSNQNMLMRIFDNLISNALKHGNGDLKINVKSTENLQITFTNEYSSADMNIEHIFDEFYTTDISRTKGNTGLGLAISKQFTELLGGNIQANLNGNSFILTITFTKK